MSGLPPMRTLPPDRPSEFRLMAATEHRLEEVARLSQFVLAGQDRNAVIMRQLIRAVWAMTAASLVLAVVIAAARWLP